MLGLACTELINETICPAPLTCDGCSSTGRIGGRLHCRVLDQIALAGRVFGGAAGGERPRRTEAGRFGVEVLGKLRGQSGATRASLLETGEMGKHQRRRAAETRAKGFTQPTEPGSEAAHTR